MSDLKKVKAYALSDTDIRNALGDDIGFVLYPQLEHMDHIDECFDSKNRCILFCPNSSPTTGHYVCMIRFPKYIEFFDPYGEKPEEFKAGISKTRLEQMDIDKPFLTRLMRESKIPIYYNTHQFQALDPNVATCGKHCITRLLYAPYNLNKYYNIIKKSKMTPDDFVSGLIYSKIKK
jgi:hypothetical protein